MAAINFPAASESPWYNPDNGITYEYIGGTWRSVNQLSGAFDDKYVEVAGDNMTGNLTLGDGTTDKIELKAGDGSATFAGDVKSGPDNSRMTPSGYAEFKRTGISASGRRGSNFLNTSIDGSFDASFASGVTDASGTGQLAACRLDHTGFYVSQGITGDAIKLAPDGSATFAGDVTINNAENESFVIYSADAQTVNNSVGLTLKAKSDNGDGSTGSTNIRYTRNGGQRNGYLSFLQTKDGSNLIETHKFDNDGSATFAGRVNAGSSTLNDSIGLAGYNNSNINQHPTLFLRNYGSSNTGLLIEGRNNAGTTVYTVDSQGNSSFSALTLNLETDNPANYTTTTSIETDPETGEETTIETSVYNGPTLDVKERLQNLISRIDAIEANEIIDDATDNSLLLAIAELTSRLDERDATIADLQARITTLES